MKNLLFVLIFILYTQTSKSQSLDYGNDLAAIKICNAIQGNNFASEKAADSALEQILSVVGASKRFVLQECSNINNAVALTFNGVRYIMYDPEFMSGLRYSNDWSNMFVLAHEVGHHINGHTVDALVVSGKSQVPLYTKRTQELESDEFAGFVLGRLGANLNQALSAVNNTSDADDSYSTHPRRSKRIAAVKKGFNESGGKVSSSNSGSREKIYDSPYSNSRYKGVDYVTKEFAGGVYEGTVSKESRKPFGYGVYKTAGGMKYEGEWSGGNFNGYGSVLYASGTTYEGEWVEDKQNGKGVKTYANGTKMIGTFANNSLSGNDCKIIYSNAILEGRFELGAIIKATFTDKEDGSSYEIGFSNTTGDGLTTYTNENISFTGNFKNGRVVGKPIKQYKGKGYRKYARQMGIDYFIPEFVFRDLDIEFGKNAPKIGYLERNYNNGEGISKGYFIHSFWEPKRAGFIEHTLDSKWVESADWLKLNDTKFDKFQGMYWNGQRNGYGIKFYKGKIVEKGIYKNGEFMKYEDFDLNLMLETYKDFY
jgi:hypothetical protein